MADEEKIDIWKNIRSDDVMQGDLLPRMKVPFFWPKEGSELPSDKVDIDEFDLIVMTQSCELENQKSPFVIMCRVLTIEAISGDFQRAFGKKLNDSQLDSIRKGMKQGLHMLACPEDPHNNRKSLIVDFRMAVSLPVEYINFHAKSLPSRWRLLSPFSEHMSQAFGVYFMRVALPWRIPEFQG